MNKSKPQSSVGLESDWVWVRGFFVAVNYVVELKFSGKISLSPPVFDNQPVGQDHIKNQKHF